MTMTSSVVSVLRSSMRRGCAVRGRRGAELRHRFTGRYLISDDIPPEFRDQAVQVTLTQAGSAFRGAEAPEHWRRKPGSAMTVGDPVTTIGHAGIDHRWLI